MKNRFISTDLLILILTVAAAAFAVVAAVLDPGIAGVVGVGLLIVALILGVNANATRKIVKSIHLEAKK